ncbi:hypothetical protein MKY30_16175 [Oceanobacillus sp. FSL W8-0428]
MDDEVKVAMWLLIVLWVFIIGLFILLGNVHGWDVVLKSSFR